MFDSLEAAIKAYMESVPYRPSMAGLAIGGPVAGDRFQLTNRPWSFTRDDLMAASGAKHVHVVNDFEALALSLPYLTAHDLAKIGGGEPTAGGVRAIAGPGTGLGVAALVSSPSGGIGIGSEGGHVSFPLETGEEAAIVDLFRDGESHVSAERLISGPGLARLYGALAQLNKRDSETLTAPEIVKRGLAKDDPLAADALALFVKWLGRFAGDVALMYGATGGMYLAGGIPPSILDLLASDAFRGPFLAKGRLADYLERIPVHVIKSQEAGLKGAAIALSAALPAS
jgi:glucokinase